MEIRPINLADDAEILACWDIMLAERIAQDPGFVPDPVAARLSIFRQGPSGSTQRRLVAVSDEGVVGVGSVAEPDQQPDSAYVSVNVDAAHRRRGIGRALLRRIEAATARPVLLASYTTESAARDAAAPAFAEAHGYREHTREVQRRLPWPPPPEALHAPETPGYAVRAHVGGLPEDAVDAYCRYAAATFAEAPNGDVPYGDGAVDHDLYAERMRRMSERGLTRVFGVAADDVTGEVVAISDATFHPTDPAGGVGFTYVAPAHRGHGLGLATKVAVHRALLEAGAPLTGLPTTNNLANGHMISINERLGFAVVRTFVELLKRR